MTRPAAPALAALLASLAAVSAATAAPKLSAEDKAAICAEAAERYRAETGRIQADEPVVTVLTYKNVFCPSDVTVKRGAVLRFVNVDRRTSHTVWLREAGREEGPRFFPGENHEITVDLAPGTHEFLCGPHWAEEGMKGTVTVTGTEMTIGKVTLVGAGPGDPELLTLKAVRAIAGADVVVHDRLVSKPILDVAGETTTRISVGKAAGHHSVRQEEINGLLVHLARAGKSVVRLKGGDPFIFGRGYEEIETLIEAGIPWSVVPGITAAQGCAAAAGVPLTHRGLARSVRYVTGHCRDDEPLDLDWAGLADPETTLAVYMGHATAPQFARELLAHGRASSTPVLCISQGTTPTERRMLTTVGRLVPDLARARLPAPVLFIVGEVVTVGHDRAKVEEIGLEDARRLLKRSSSRSASRPSPSAWPRPGQGHRHRTAPGSPLSSSRTAAPATD